MESRNRILLIVPLFFLQSGCAAPWPFAGAGSRAALPAARDAGAVPVSPYAAARPLPESPPTYPGPSSTFARPPGPGTDIAAATDANLYVPPTTDVNRLRDIGADHGPLAGQAPQLAAAFAPPGEIVPASTEARSVGATFTPAQIIATVGNQHILYGDLEGIVNLMMVGSLAKLSPDEMESHREEIAAQKEGAIRSFLEQEIQTKLVYLDFVRTVPSDKLGEVQKRVADAFQKDFDEIRQKVATADEEQVAKLARSNPILVRLAVMMKQQQLDSPGELDAFLRNHGSSLDKQKRAFGEFMLAQMMIARNIKQNVEITHEQMLLYYREHAAEYAVPARAKWEQLSVRFERFSSKEEAFDALAAMGNQVYLGGAALPAVAKRGSQEPNADQGGFHDWTAQGSLASQVLEDAIFTLPIGRLSQIIEDPRGYHIVRVAERSEATSIPFTEAQVEIKEKIKNERRQNDVKQYLDRLQKTTAVWRYYDENSAASSTAQRGGRPLSPERR